MMKWVTNAQESQSQDFQLRGFLIGLPAATEQYTVSELVNFGMIGVYMYGAMLADAQNSGCALAYEK